MIPPQPSYAVSTVLLGASMNISSRRRAFIAGTLMLTAAGFSSRILGFFYRIYLSRTIGAEGLGVYNMIHPIFGVCFALCAGSIQTAISRFVAANVQQGKAIFRTGLLISLSMSLVLAAAICRFAPFLAEHVLLEPRCALLLPIMAFSVPCAAVHACINGCYYGLQRTKVPAFTQLAEQAVRICAVFLIADILTDSPSPSAWPCTATSSGSSPPPSSPCCPSPSSRPGVPSAASPAAQEKEKTGFLLSPPPSVISQPSPPASWPWPCLSWETAWC